MSSKGRRAARRAQPGLTLIELLGVIAILGLAGLLIGPRLAPIDGPWAAGVQAPDGPCPYSSGEGLYSARRPAEYVGIGAIIVRQPIVDDFVRIHRVFPNSPAEQADLQPGDIIQAVDGASVQNQGTDRVTRMITDGEVGTPVTLTIARSGLAEPFEVTITRQNILTSSPPGPPGE